MSDSLWECRQLHVGYPTSEQEWRSFAAPARLIHGRDVLAHAQVHFAAKGNHYLTVRLSADAITTRPVLDDETMAELPLVGGVVDLRLVKLL